MANIVAGSIGDIIEIVLAIGLAYFSLYLQRGFKGGIMETPFKMITLSIIAFTLSQAFNLISEFWSYGDIADLLDVAFGIVFVLTAFLGFYKLYKAWHVDTSSIEMETDKPSIPAVAV
jgi:hypothetical protein